MALNKLKNNMYEFIEDTRNFIGGECSHKCKYCYVNSMKNRNPVIMKKYSGEPRLYEKEFKKKFTKGKLHFIGSMIDMFAENIPSNDISEVINHCSKFYESYFLFQSKNPERFMEFNFPINTIFGTTIENDFNELSLAPSIQKRIESMARLSNLKYTTMITIEPILEFDLKELVSFIRFASPTWVNIGSDSKKNNLPEPSWDRIEVLIGKLREFTKVNLKPNLDRLKIATSPLLANNFKV